MSSSGLTNPVQIAYGVPDVRSAAARWVRWGVGPFFVADHIAVDNVRVDGAPSSFDHSSAYAWWGDVMIELICQHGTPTVVAPSGVHHVAFFVDDLTATQDELVATGHPEVLYAQTPGGQAFAMHDARPTLGHLIEIYEPTPRLTGFYDMVRDASREAPGPDNIRTL